MQDYSYLRASGCCEIAGVDDAADFLQVKHSLNVVGIDGEAQVLDHNQGRFPREYVLSTLLAIT